MQEPGDRLVVLALGQRHARLLQHLVGTQESRQRPRAVGAVPARRDEAVVLVEHLADDLLDEVLDRDHAVGAAELVDHDGHLHALVAQEGEQRVELEAVGHGGDRPRDLGEPHAAAAVGRDRHGLLDVDEADDVVGRPPDHGEPRVTGLARGVDDVERGVARLQEVHAHTRRADVGGGAVAEGDAAGDEVGGLVVDGALPRRPQHERAQLEWGAGRAQLLLGLDTEAEKGPVRGAVEEPDGPRHDAREDALGQLGEGGDPLRQRERQVLGDELADEHRDDRAEEQRDGVGGGALGAARDAGVLERDAHEPPDGRLREEADREVRDGDAELGAAELRGERPQCCERAGGAGLAGLGGALDGRAVDGDERELGRDEDAAGQHEEERCAEEQELGHGRGRRRGSAVWRSITMATTVLFPARPHAPRTRTPGPAAPMREVDRAHLPVPVHRLRRAARGPPVLQRRRAHGVPRVRRPPAQGVQRRRRRLQGLRLLPHRQPRQLHELRRRVEQLQHPLRSRQGLLVQHLRVRRHVDLELVVGLLGQRLERERLRRLSTSRPPVDDALVGPAVRT